MPRRKFVFDKSCQKIVEVTPAEDLALCDEITRSVIKEPLEFGIGTGHRRPVAKWPIASEAAAVNPEDVPAEQAALAAKGVYTEFDRAGRPLFRDKAHRKAHCRAIGMYDKDAGYDDPEPLNFRASDFE